MGKRIFLPLFFIFAAANGFSASLAFQIVQHNDSLKKICLSAYVIEDEIMNYFFENGFVVSNSSAEVSFSAEDDQRLWSDGYYGAASGAFDDFVQIHLYFAKNANDEGKVALSLIDTISWKIISVKSGKCLEESKKSIGKPMNKDSEENVRNFANDFASHIKTVLRNGA